MKRKLSALLAIVLAVVMVFPTAVFVGAVGPAEAKMMATVTGSINSNGTLADPIVFNYVDKKVTGEFKLSLDDSASIKVEIEKAEYENLVVTQTYNSGVVNVTGKNNSYTVTTGIDYSWGSSKDTDVITFTADKIGKDSSGKKTTTPTVLMELTVKVLPKEIIDMRVYGKSPAFSDEKVLDGTEDYNANQDLTITKVDVLYNNDKGTWKSVDIPASASNMKLDVVHINSSKSRMNIGTMLVDLIGDDDYLAYTYTDPNGLTFSDQIDLHVTTSDVESVTIEPVAGADLRDEGDITEAGFLERIKVIVDLKEHEENLYYTGTAAKSNPKFKITYFEDTQNKAKTDFNKDAYFTIEYEDVIYESSKSGSGLKVIDFFSFQKNIPVNVEINWDNARTTSYYEGYVIGTKRTDWTDVEVTVTYAAEVPGSGTSGSFWNPGTPDTNTIVYDTVEEIVALNLVLSPINARQKFVIIESIMGHEMNISSNLPTGFDLLYREVTSIEIDSSTTSGKTTYTEGDTLNLSGVKAIINYNYGEPEKLSITNDSFTCNPKHGDELTTSIGEVLVVYTDPNTGIKEDTTLSITVNAKPEEKKAIKEIKFLNSYSAKREYFIGEEFDPDGFEFLLVYSDATTAVKDLKEYKSSLSVNSTKYDNSKDEFTAAMDGDLKVNFDIRYNSKDYDVTLTIPNIVVTKRPVLDSISVSAKKLTYMEGEAPKVSDFVITAKYDDRTTRVFEVASDATGASKTSYTTTTGGVTYTLKLTPTAVAADTKNIRATYSEKVSGYTTVSKYADVEIEVTIPDAILTYYDVDDKAYVTNAYEDLYDALEKAEEIADSYTSYYSNRTPEIELRRDVTMTADFPTTESIDIDLNGHSLTMIRGEVSVSSKAASDVEVTFLNTAKDDAKLVYSTDDEDTVIIKYNDSYVIDKNTDSDGKYEVVISSVKNGKVTGPDEVTHGHDAQFTITPDEGYVIASIRVNNKSQSIPSDGKLVVKDVQAKVTVTVTFQEKAWDNPFTDVYKSATYYKAIQFVYENGLFSGMSATKFEPDTTMTRAMFVTVLGRLAGIDADEAASRYGTRSDFTDVSATDASISYAVPYIKWASDNGLIEGYGNGKFGPKDNITHAQMYVLMQRYAAFIERKNTNAGGTNIAANDTRDIPDWAYEAVEYASKYDFMITSSYKLTPNGNAKRSELAMLLEKFCVNVMNWDSEK